MEHREKIDSMIKMSRAWSLCIAQLVEVCQNLQQQNETNKREIRKMRESQHKNEQKINEEREVLNSKLDVVVEYINDQEVI